MSAADFIKETQVLPILKATDAVKVQRTLMRFVMGNHTSWCVIKTLAFEFLTGTEKTIES